MLPANRTFNCCCTGSPRDLQLHSHYTSPVLFFFFSFGTAYISKAFIGVHCMMKKEQEGKFKVIPSSAQTARPKRAVPPGYLHDLLHSRHLMKTVGLRSTGKGGDSMDPLKGRGRRLYNKPSLTGSPKLPELFEQRKLFLQKRKKTMRYHVKSVEEKNDEVEGVGLLSLPEDILLKVVCYLEHDDIKPLFQVCKELGNTLRNAIKFHFNYATPTVALGEEAMPVAKRAQKRRAVTAYADVMAHLKKGQRNVIERDAPSSTHSTAPRALRFTPQSTPQPARKTATELDFE